MIAEQKHLVADPSAAEVFELAFNFRYEETLLGFLLARNAGRDLHEFENLYSLHGVVRGAYLRIMTGAPTTSSVGSAIFEAAETAYAMLESLCKRTGFVAEYFKASVMLAGMQMRAGQAAQASSTVDEAFRNGADRIPSVRMALLLLRIRLLTSSGQKSAAFDLAETLVARPFEIIEAPQVAELNMLYGSLCKETSRLDAFEPVVWRGLRVAKGNPRLRSQVLNNLLDIYGSREAVDAKAAPGSVEATILRLVWAERSATKVTAADFAARIDAYLEDHNYFGPRAQHGVYFNGALPLVGTTHRILVTRGVGGLGDLLLMTPGIRALRGLNPESEIVFAVPGNLVKVLNSNPHCSVVDIGSPDLDVRDFDAWYNLSDCPASRHESNTVPNVTKSRIELFAEGMGVESEELTRFGRRPVYVVGDEERAWAREFLKKKGSRPFVAVQLQAADQYRDYPHLETVVKALAERSDVLVFNDRPFPGFEYDHVTRVHGLKLRRAFAVVSLCDVVVAPDSSFIHLAGALDLPCVALFGPIDGRMRTQDYPRCITLDAKDLHACMPCWRDEFTKCRVTDGRRSQCMADIDPRKVIETTINLKEIEPCRLL
jgi:ADP-heptose:LPS heptosyltransferase